jgi:hypothetical protein
MPESAADSAYRLPVTPPPTAVLGPGHAAPTIRASRIAQIALAVEHPDADQWQSAAETLASMPGAREDLAYLEELAGGPLTGPLRGTCVWGANAPDPGSPAHSRGASITLRRAIALWPSAHAALTPGQATVGEVVALLTDLGAKASPRVRRRLHHAAQQSRHDATSRLAPIPVEGPDTGWDAITPWLGGLLFDAAVVLTLAGAPDRLRRAERAFFEAMELEAETVADHRSPDGTTLLLAGWLADARLLHDALDLPPDWMSPMSHMNALAAQRDFDPSATLDMLWGAAGLLRRAGAFPAGL